jgi:hypothetical protein
MCGARCEWSFATRMTAARSQPPARSCTSSMAKPSPSRPMAPCGCGAAVWRSSASNVAKPSLLACVRREAAHAAGVRCAVGQGGAGVGRRARARFCRSRRGHDDAIDSD